MLIWQSSVLGWFLWMKIYQLDIDRKLQFGDAKGWNPESEQPKLICDLVGGLISLSYLYSKFIPNTNHLCFSSLGFCVIRVWKKNKKGEIQKIRGIKIHHGVFQRPDVGILRLLSGDPRYWDQSWWSGIPQRNRWVLDLNVGNHRWKIWKKKASILNSV